MRLFCSLLACTALLMVAACRERRESEGQGAEFARGEVRRVDARQPKNIAVVLSGTENDPWTAEIVAALGAALGFDPWEGAGHSGHLDILGPFLGRLGERPVTVSIALSGLTALADLQSQHDLGVDAAAWARAQQPDLVWLDGDLAQFVIGRELAADLPLLFTGVVSDRQAYYGGEASVTGVYRRHSLPRVLEEIWKRDPEAARFALVSDESPLNRASALKAKQLLDLALTGRQRAILAEPAGSWSELKVQLQQFSASSDAIIVCGIGDEGSPEALRTKCPADLLAGISIPVIALGPTGADACGPLVLSLRPAEHVKAALHSAALILSGGNPAAIPVVTPEEMAVYERQGS